MLARSVYSDIVFVDALMRMGWLSDNCKYSSILHHSLPLKLKRHVIVVGFTALEFLNSVVLLDQLPSKFKPYFWTLATTVMKFIRHDWQCIT